MGAVAACIPRTQGRSRRSCQGTRHMVSIDTELWAIELALVVAIEKGEILNMYRVKTVAVSSNSQAEI